MEAEQRVERKDLQPDLVGVTSDGNRWCIEIRNTHEVDEAKKKKILESSITCLEIDVREQTLESLKTFLLESLENREWINNPIYENRIAESVRNKVSMIVSHFKEIHELQIDKGDNIHLKDIVASVSDNGQYATIRANSTNDVPYLFHIGRLEILEQIQPQNNCKELTVDIDKYPVEIKRLDVSYMKRIYLYIPKCKQSTETKDYYNNPQYEIRPKADCDSPKCQYRLHDGKCIYQKEVIRQEGKDYVVCMTEKKRRDAAKKVVSNPTPPIGFSPKLPHKTQVRPQLENISSDKLPFEGFWSIDDYYQELWSTKTYRTEKGISAKILHIDKVSDRIIVLYRDPAEERPIYPYHISILSVRDGEICKNKVADFTNQREAENSYNQRRSGMV